MTSHTMTESKEHDLRQTDIGDNRGQWGDTQHDIFDMQRLGKRQEFKV